jgi:Xaa-Pro aminopeptidase
MNQRVQQLRERLSELRIQYFLVSDPYNLRYLLGFTGSNGAALVTPEKVTFITDPRYGIQAGEEVRDAEVVLTTDSLFRPLKQKALVPERERLGFEAHHLTFRQFSTLRALLPQVRFTATEHIVERIASHKDEGEIERIRRANQICAAAFADLLPKIQVGADCFELAAELSYLMKQHGGEADAFEPIVASGARSALPHARVAHQQIQPGEFLLIDFGCYVDGYAADVTRTVVVGEATARQREMYDAVLQANQISIEAAKPGMLAVELDRVARQYLEERGFAKLFVHSLGHGLGLRVHDLPRVSKRSKDRLEAGNVITIEPGIYEVDFGGVRIEDDVVLRESGAEVLTSIPKELICVG